MATVIACPQRPLASRTLGAYLRALRADPCSYCGDVGEALDHIDARDGGGVTAWENLTSACHSCNGEKSKLTLLGFLGRRQLTDPLPPAEDVVHLLQPTDIRAIVRRAWREVGT